MEKDPKLLQRRVYAGPTAEKETSQKIIQFITSIGFMAMLVVPALDRRFAWPTVPLYASVVGDVLVAIGFLIIFFVYKENTFTSATIEVYPRTESRIDVNHSPRPNRLQNSHSPSPAYGGMPGAIGRDENRPRSF